MLAELLEGAPFELTAFIYCILIDPAGMNLGAAVRYTEPV